MLKKRIDGTRWLMGCQRWRRRSPGWLQVWSSHSCWGRISRLPAISLVILWLTSLLRWPGLCIWKSLNSALKKKQKQAWKLDQMSETKGGKKEWNKKKSVATNEFFRERRDWITLLNNWITITLLNTGVVIIWVIGPTKRKHSGPREQDLSVNHFCLLVGVKRLFAGLQGNK